MIHTNDFILSSLGKWSMIVPLLLGILLGGFIKPSYKSAFPGKEKIYIERLSNDLQLPKEKKHEIEVVFNFWQKERDFIRKNFFRLGPGSAKNLLNKADWRFKARMGAVLRGVRLHSTTIENMRILED